jgi:hypothetical protein
MSRQADPNQGNMSVHVLGAVREHLDALQHQVTELKGSVEQARRETSQQVTAHGEQVKEALNRQSESASEAGQAADQSQNQWQAMKTQAAARMRDLHGRVERRRGEIRADIADDDANDAAASAVDALDYAQFTV